MELIVRSHILRGAAVLFLGRNKHFYATLHVHRGSGVGFLLITLTLFNSYWF